MLSHLRTVFFRISVACAGHNGGFDHVVHRELVDQELKVPPLTEAPALVGWQWG